MSKVYQMGIEATLEVIGGKWKPLILCNLGHGPMRTGELKRNLPNVTQKMLTQQLRELENNQIIAREVYNQVPPKVVYSLTEEGKTLRDILIAMSEWGEKRIEQAQLSGEELSFSRGYEGFMEM